MHTLSLLTLFHTDPDYLIVGDTQGHIFTLPRKCVNHTLDKAFNSTLPHVDMARPEYLPAECTEWRYFEPKHSIQYVTSLEQFTWLHKQQQYSLMIGFNPDLRQWYVAGSVHQEAP